MAGDKCGEEERVVGSRAVSAMQVEILPDPAGCYQHSKAKESTAAIRSDNNQEKDADTIA